MKVYRTILSKKQSKMFNPDDIISKLNVLGTTGLPRTNGALLLPTDINGTRVLPE